MLRAHTVDQVRAAEVQARSGLAPDTLMRRAATALAHVVARELRARHGRAYGRSVLMLVGTGDNGGDALHAGADLVARGVAVHAVLVGDRAHPEGLARFTAAGGRLGPPQRPVDVVLDAIVGLSARPGLRPAALAAWDHARRCSPQALVVAVDLPSGVDPGTGECPAAHLLADLTVTFGTHKPAHLLDPAALACGRVELIDLALPLPATSLEALENGDVAALLPTPTPTAHKYGRGVLGVAAGSAAYPGAGLLTIAGAATGLCGMVRDLTSTGWAREQVLATHPEVVMGPGRVQAVAVGSGLHEAASIEAAVALASEHGARLVADAGALEWLSVHRDRARDLDVVITPHAGELATLLQTDRASVEARMGHHARVAAERFGATVLLKGRRTVIAQANGRMRVNLTGTPWLAGAGAGDVLTGVIGSLLAAGLDGFDAASAGAWLHAQAATRASDAHHGGPLRASEVAQQIPATIGATLATSRGVRIGAVTGQCEDRSHE